MSIQLKPEEHDALRRYVDRKRKPTIRQKALALLGLAEGESLESLSIRLGITKVYLSELVARFSEERLAVIGLLDSGVSKELKRAVGLGTKRSRRLRTSVGARGLQGRGSRSGNWWRPAT